MESGVAVIFVTGDACLLSRRSSFAFRISHCGITAIDRSILFNNIADRKVENINKMKDAEAFSLHFIILNIWHVQCTMFNDWFTCEKIISNSFHAHSYMTFENFAGVFLFLFYIFFFFLYFIWIGMVFVSNENSEKIFTL